MVPKHPSERGYPYHTLFDFIEDIQDLLPNVPRKIAFEKVTRIVSECPRLQEISVNF